MQDKQCMNCYKSADCLGRRQSHYNLHGDSSITCLPHKDGGIPLSDFPKDTAS